MKVKFMVVLGTNEIHSIVTVPDNATDEEITERLQDYMDEVVNGYWEEIEDDNLN